MVVCGLRMRMECRGGCECNVHCMWILKMDHTWIGDPISYSIFGVAKGSLRLNLARLACLAATTAQAGPFSLRSCMKTLCDSWAKALTSAGLDSDDLSESRVFVTDSWIEETQRRMMAEVANQTHALLLQAVHVQCM